MIRSILKYALIGVVACIICYIGLTAYGEVTQTEAAKASESYQLAQAQAQNMSQALTEVSNFGAADQQQLVSQVDTGSQSSAVQDAVPKSFADIDGSRSPGTAGPKSQAQPEPATPTNIAKITDLDVLVEEWRPRYDAAKVAYVKFEASVNNAKSHAADYFTRQQAITAEQIRDPVNQAKARQEDEWEMSLYQQWEAKADSALNTAAEVGIQLDDMDAYLQKLKLRADFVFDPSQFQEVPRAIIDLNKQLADFQTASENIRTATGSPFEAK